MGRVKLLPLLPYVGRDWQFNDIGMKLNHPSFTITITAADIPVSCRKR